MEDNKTYRQCTDKDEHVSTIWPAIKQTAPPNLMQCDPAYVDDAFSKIALLHWQTKVIPHVTFQNEYDHSHGEDRTTQTDKCWSTEFSDLKTQSTMGDKCNISN